MDDCCSTTEHEISALRDGMKRVLITVLAINVAMFVAEFAAGVIAHSTALMADAVDMRGDALVYGLSLYAAFGWPDIVVGGIIALLFFRSAIRVLRQAWPQFRAGVLT